VLSQVGVAAALEDVARHVAAVQVRARAVSRYDEAVEAAVYFTCREALQNALKHAPGASAVAITLTDARDGRLDFAVTDDGPGLVDGWRAGAGMRSMRDRIAAIGGRLAIEPAMPSGVRVAGSVPAAPRAG
jgi:signal transduction histidine kinase